MTIADAAAATAFVVVVVAAAYVALVVAPAAVVAVVLAIVAPAIADVGPPLPPRIVDRNSLAKLDMRVEKFPPSKRVAPAVRAGSWAC